MRNEKIELLAPCGNYNCLLAAIEGGADAVYLAGENFGARSYAQNFSDEELKKATDYCHLRGVKVYVTVNTLIFDKELRAAEEYLKMLCEIGVDAVIVSDLGLINIIRHRFPSLPIHASTQMTVHNAEGVLFLEKLGISQVVLSRELSLDEIEKIKNRTSAKLEVFAHGALCMSYSGQCLLSSVLGGRSGNRGKCAQPCRLEYEINGKQKGTYLSLKDLCALEHIERLRKIGVSSLKIEGRMKGAEYVKTVCRVYRKYIDSGDMPTKKDLERLDRIFFRGGLSDGYLTGKQGKEMFCFRKPENPYKKQEKTEKDGQSLEKKLRLCAKVNINEGAFPKILIEGEGETASYCGNEIVLRGEKRVLDEGQVCEKISKTGGTPYEFEKIEVSISGAPFMSASSLNALRREGLLCFEEKFLAKFKKEVGAEIQMVSDKVKEKARLVCRVSSKEQFYAANKFDFEKITVPSFVILENYEEFLPFKDKIIIETAAILKEEPRSLEKLKEMGFLNLSVSNVSLLNQKDFRLFGSFRLNASNSYALQLLKNFGLESAALSPELSLAAIRDMKKPILIEAMVYGYLPLMTTENCIIRNGGKCPCNKETAYIKDRKGVLFPVVRDGQSCRSVLLNSTPTFMGDRLFEVEKAGVERLMLYFTIENAQEVEKICKIYFSREGKIENYTRLHFGKGVL